MSNAADENTQAVQGLTRVLKQAIQGPPNPQALPAALNSPALAAATARPTTPLEEALKRIGALLADGDRVSAILKAAGDLGILAPRLLLLAADWPWAIPPGDSPAEFARSCVSRGWQALPSALGPPRTGDLFVVTGEGREIVDVGLVGVVDTEGEFVRGGSAAGRDLRERRPCGEVDFWLRLPCRECDEAKARAQMRP
jgi:hypothetical protein